MFGFLRPNPIKALEKQIAQKRAASVGVQRSGDLRAYASMIAEIEKLEDELIQLRDRPSD